MAIERPRLLHRVEFAAICITLMAMAVAMGGLVFIMADQVAKESDPQLRKTLARMAWLAFAMMTAVILLLVWLVMRYVSLRMREKKTKPPPTPYFDAWAEAGKRLKLPPDAPETLADLGIGIDEDQAKEEDEDTTKQDGDRDE